MKKRHRYESQVRLQENISRINHVPIFSIAKSIRLTLNGFRTGETVTESIKSVVLPMRYLLILCCFLVSLAVSAQNAKIDSLKRVIATTKVDTVKTEMLCLLCEELTMVGEVETALQKGEEGLHLATHQKNSSQITHCLNVIGINYWNQGKYSNALMYFKKNEAIFAKRNNLEGLSQVFSNIGLVYQDQGNYTQALVYYQKSLRGYEKLNKPFNIALISGNIGIMYCYKKNYALALNYFEQSLQIYQKLGDQEGIADCFNNIVGIYKEEGKLDKAFEYQQKSLRICEAINDELGIANSFYNIGEIYVAQANLLKGLDYQQQALSRYRKIGDISKISLCLSGIASTQLQMGKPVLAKFYAEKSLQLAQEIKHLETIKFVSRVIYQADSAVGNWQSAFEHHQLFKQYSDSLNNEDKAKEFGRVESKYQFEKEAEEQKRKETELAKIENERKERRNNLQYLTIFAGIIGLFAGLVFFGKFKIPTRVLDIAVFAGLLITFEFLLILFDPWFDRYSAGIPFYKLGFNTMVAFAFAPLHGFLEDKLKKRLVKTS